MVHKSIIFSLKCYNFRTLIMFFTNGIRESFNLTKIVSDGEEEQEEEILENLEGKYYVLFFLSINVLNFLNIFVYL